MASSDFGEDMLTYETFDLEESMFKIERAWSFDWSWANFEFSCGATQVPPSDDQDLWVKIKQEKLKMMIQKARQERLKKEPKEKLRQERLKKAFQEWLEKLGSGNECLLKQHHVSSREIDLSRSGGSASDQSSFGIPGIALPNNFGLHFSQGEISKEAGRIKISEDTVTDIPRMPNEGTESIEAQMASPTSLVPCPNRRETSNEAGKGIEIREEYDTLTVISPNDLARTTTSSFASSHNSSDVPNCNLIKAEDKTAVLHFSQQQSSTGSDVRIDILEANYSQDLTTMSDGPSQETRFPHDINNIIPGTSTLMPDGPSQQTRLSNDNSNTTHEDPVMMPDGLASSGDDDDDNDVVQPRETSNDEVQPRETRFPNGINNAILGFTGQTMATIVAAHSPRSLTVRLFACATGIGFFGTLFAALFLKRHPNIAKTLFKIGVSASAFTVMIALGQYLPMKWYLDTAVPAVACLIIAVVVALSKLD